MFKDISKKTKLWLGLYLGLLLIYGIFSYGLTAPNLILIKAEWFTYFQFWMWQTFFNNRELLTRVFTILLTLLFSTYALLCLSIKKNQLLSLKQQLALLALFSAPLLLSYNALSFDVFNYIFNSRMIWLYQVNPHLRTAMEFSYDPWTRFMHNVHTPAPYGHGWTAFSLLPYILGLGKFLLTWINFRILSIISLLLTNVVLNKLHQQLFKSDLSFLNWALFFLNPLVLIEIISNAHNDLWMMLLALTGIWLLIKAVSEKNKLSFSVLGLLVWAISISIKFASLALAPVYGILLLLIFLPNIFSKFKQYLPHLILVASILMFLPLITARSQQFHPWYLTWALCWLPIIKNKYWRVVLIAFSITSLFRYLPWLSSNDYTQQVLLQQKLITWSAIILVIIFIVIRFFVNQKKTIIKV